MKILAAERLKAMSHSDTVAVLTAIEKAKQKVETFKQTDPEYASDLKKVLKLLDEANVLVNKVANHD